MSFIGEFKKFALKGNVVDMAVGIIIGAAFGKIVSSVVADIIMPPIGLLVGGVNFTDLAWKMKPEVLDELGNIVTPAVTLNYGNFLQVTLDFLIVAFAVFLLVKFINELGKKTEELTKKKQAEQAAAPAEPAKPVISKEESLLTEIRDLLAKK
ncbi:MAG: large-conductance mechanosensitive channel protein MscL [Bacteroidales bacterium]|jgi:large conductance mechanosensitive channel|nr:large-conductance mechanosensitive channel protein MscL [Bacteroidales bacterium]NLB02505.1 large-conductance mechanosensitive channel protein MscL [Bacteroidales bacterium]